MTDMKTYRVEVVEIETGVVLAVFGRGLSKRKAEKRVETVISRINIGLFFVRDVLEKL